MNDLSKKHCVPCEGGTNPFSKKEALEYLKITRNWELLATQGNASSSLSLRAEGLEPMRIQRKFIFKNFQEALDFVNKVGKLAESEDHHPDIFIHNYKKVDITLSTHAIGGLSINDFILAAKINQIP